MGDIWKNVRNREVAYQAVLENTYEYPRGQGWSPLTYAGFRGHLAVIDALTIDLEWNPDKHDINLFTALYAATLGNQVLAVKRLLHWGADPFKPAGPEQYTPMQAAQLLGFEHIVDLFDPK